MECIGSTGTGVTEGCEQPRGFWELNPGLLEEQSVLLIDEPSSPAPQSFNCTAVRFHLGWNMSPFMLWVFSESVTHFSFSYQGFVVVV